MHPFTQVQYETFRTHGHRYDEFARRFEQYCMTIGAGDPESDSDLEEIRYVYTILVPIYLRMRAYRDAVSATVEP